MSDVAEEKLYGLLEIAEQQQVAAQTALDGLATERAAFAEERKHWAESIGPFSEEMRALVLQAVTGSMADVVETGTEAVKGATAPLLDILDDMSEQAKQAETSLRVVVQWASWRLLGWGLATIASLALLWWLAVCAVLWWDTTAIGQAQVQKAQIEIEITKLQASHDAWVKAGMLGKLDRCGPKQRPCVQVDESAGSYGNQSDYRIIRGY